MPRASQSLLGALLCTCAAWPSWVAHGEHTSLDVREAFREHTSHELRGESRASSHAGRERAANADSSSHRASSNVREVLAAGTDRREAEPENRGLLVDPDFKHLKHLKIETSDWKAFMATVCLKKEEGFAWWRMFGGLWHMSLKNTCSLYYGWKNEQGGSIGATDYKKKADEAERDPIGDVEDTVEEVPKTASEVHSDIAQDVGKEVTQNSRASHSSGLPRVLVLPACWALAWVLGASR